MARSEIPMVVNLRQNKNELNKSFGKYFCEVDPREPLNLKGFAAHIHEHGKLASFDLIQLVLNNVVSCMKELVSQGQPVKLDGLGTFYPSILNVPGGAVSVEAALDKGLENLIDGVSLNFLPEGVKGEKLTSRAFKADCIFTAGYVVESKKKTIDGKEVTYQEKIPISSFATATHQPDDPEPDPNDGD